MYHIQQQKLESPKFTKPNEHFQRMSLTNDYTPPFFDDADNMDTGNDAVVKINEEGINNVDGFEMVDEDVLKKLIDNLKLPGGQINVGGAMVAMPYFKFGEKLQMRLEAVSNLLQLYKTLGRSITNTIIQWDPIIKDCKQYW